LPIFEGEMQVTDAVLRNKRIIFNTLVPSEDPCKFGGTSWLMELDYISGATLLFSPFDLNGDDQFTSADYVTVTVGGLTITVPVSAVQSENGIASRPAILSGNGFEVVVSSTTNDTNAADALDLELQNPGPGALGRQSWRQVR